MKILIYGINYSPELIGIGKYSGEMAVWLGQQGHSVKVVTAPPYYPAWRIAKNYNNRYSREQMDGVEVTRCPLFVPSKPSALARILHLVSFSLTSVFPILGAFFWKPDIVIQIVPTLFCSLQTLALSKFSGAKAVIHIQDYEVDAMLGLSMISHGVIQRCALWIEQKIFNSFDVVSTISEGMLNNALQKGVAAEKLIFFPNWTEIDRFANVDKSTSIHKDIGIEPHKKIILYSGNMGEKQGLEIVVNVAKQMSLNTEVHFVMVGDGAARVTLEKLATSLSLTNITFLPLQASEDFPKFLASAACHLIIQKSGVANAVLPSKLTNILAVGGNSVITAARDTTLGALCLKFDGIATLVEPESTDALHEGILSSLNMPKFNSIARQYAQEYLDKSVVLTRFIQEITQAQVSVRSSDSAN